MNDSQHDQHEFDSKLGLSTGKLLILSVVSANVYLFLSLVIIKYWHDGWLADLFNSGYTVPTQIFVGSGCGLAAALIIYMIITVTPVSKILSDFSVFKMLAEARFSLFDKSQISFFAGAGEELLFRGALQPILGNTFTSVIFIGIHGYFKFTTPLHILFGLMMFGLSFMLGFLAEYVGLFSAMIAHMLYDLLILMLLQKNRNQQYK